MTAHPAPERRYRPLRLRASTQQPSGAPQPQDLINAMQGNALTQGWDVVTALGVPQINTLFQSQFATNLGNGSNLPPINDSVSLGWGQAVQFKDVVLGPPLIHFDPTTQPQEAQLTLPVLTGVVNQVMGSNNGETVLAVQALTESQGFAVTGRVPLCSVDGTVEVPNDVVLDVANGADFAAQLGIPAAAQSLVGEYIRQILQNNAALYSYPLGTLMPAPGDLDPVSFNFATQVDQTDSSDLGRVLLFIATQYNRDGGAQTSLALPNIVPAGYTTTLLVSSNVLFTNILLPRLQANMPGANPQAMHAGVDKAYSISTTSGHRSIGVLSSATARSGRCLNDVKGKDEKIELPLSPLTWAAGAGGQLTVTGDLACKTPFYSINPDYPKAPPCSCSSTTLHAELTCAYEAQVSSVQNSVAQSVTFAGAVQSSVTFDAHSHWENWLEKHVKGFDPNEIAAELAASLNGQLSQLFDLELPDVGVFACANLIAPSQSLFNLQQAYVPGDLAVFGTVRRVNLTISPPLTILAPGDTCQFSATQKCTWAAGMGTISSEGLYTAPGRISGALVDWISATADPAFAMAAVLVVPDQVSVSPLFVLVWAGLPSMPQLFSAAGPETSNEIVQWSVSDGAGSVSSDGTYTAPARIPAPAAGTVTANFAGRSGTATVLLLPEQPQVGAMSPSYVRLSAGGQQAFSVSADTIPGSVSWLLLPADRGSIDEAGCYCAPAAIAEMQTVAVLACGTGQPAPIAVGVVLLTPDGPAGLISPRASRA